MTRLFGTTLLVITAVGALPGTARAEEPSAAAKEAQVAAWKAISGTAPAIDRCTEAYLVEYPAAAGTVKLTATIVKDGRVDRAAATTALDGARNLRPCLEAVARSWRFPPIARDQEELSLTVQVKKGLKFTLRKPGEKAEAPAEGAQGEGPKEEVAIDFMPAFLPGGWSENPQ